IMWRNGLSGLGSQQKESSTCTKVVSAKHFRGGVQFLRSNPRWCAVVLFPVLLTAGVYEARTSAFEAHVFSAMAARLSYRIDAGPSSSIVFPQGGPFNDARGYSGIPAFSRRLTDSRFHIAAQSQFSKDLERFSHWGITPP